MIKVKSKNLINKMKLKLKENIANIINSKGNKGNVLKDMFGRGKITGNLKKGTLKNLRKELGIN